MITIWHNPRCSKSRQTLELLHRRGLRPVERRYLDDPPSAAELRVALAALGLPAFAMMRPGETAFGARGLCRTDDADTLIAAMAAEPKLIERPIVFVGDRAVIGRPPEAVLALL